MKFYHLTSIVTYLCLCLYLGCKTDSPMSLPQKSKAQNQSFAIPKDAEFKISGYGLEPAQNKHDESCKTVRPTENEIKRQFELARRLDNKELHDNYIWTPCYAEGTISLKGQIMKWRFRIGNVIETTFPDGIDKTLGGEVTDSPGGDS